MLRIYGNHGKRAPLLTIMWVGIEGFMRADGMKEYIQGDSSYSTKRIGSYKKEIEESRKVLVQMDISIQRFQSLIGVLMNN